MRCWHKSMKVKANQSLEGRAEESHVETAEGTTDSEWILIVVDTVCPIPQTRRGTQHLVSNERLVSCDTSH